MQHSTPDPRLPSICYIQNPTRPLQVILIVKGESGYTPIRTFESVADSRQECDSLNAGRNVTQDAAECMLCGSMFGWTVPGAWLPVPDPSPIFHIYGWKSDGGALIRPGFAWLEFTKFSSRSAKAHIRALQPGETYAAPFVTAAGTIVYNVTRAK